jgi:phosphonate transport system substrate-binding protein
METQPASILCKLVLRASTRRWLFLILLAISMIFSGCLSATPTLTPGPLTTPTPTPLPTATPTPQPLGHPTNPLIFGVVAFEDQPDVAESATRLAEQLTEKTGLSVQSLPVDSYQALLKEFGARKVHIAWLPPLTYLFASQHGLARAALLASHFGVYLYGTQFLANASSGFTIYFDPVRGVNLADASVALSQFDGRRPCWVDSTSASGYLVPAGLLALHGIHTTEPAFTRSHAGVVRSLYVQGICDFGATFSISGDPRTASAVLNDLPDALQRIPILWRSDPIIPNVNLALITGLPESTEKQLVDAFLEIASSPEGLALLSSSAGEYQIEALKPIDDPLYDPLREVLDALQVNLNELIGK